MTMPDDTTLSILFGFLLAVGGGLVKAYQWYVTYKERLKDKKTTATIKAKNRELSATKKLNAQMLKDFAACQQEITNLKAENQSLRETLQAALAGRRGE
jgi:uncharacterized beta-barrel protein YwiB (DUF1934 family)